MQVSVAVVKLQALVSAIKLKVDTAAPKFSADIAAVLLRADTISGNFARILKISDAATLTDVQAKELGKLFLELTAIDDSLTLEFTKGSLEAVATTEVLLRSTDKPLSDLPSVGDDPAKVFSFAPKFDYFSVADISTKVDTKNLLNNFSNREGPSVGQFYVDPTYFLEDYVLDGVPTKSFTKSIGDLLGVTDDVFGTANVDDDQTMFFSKTLLELKTASDALTIQISRTLQDTAYQSDLQAKILSRNSSDSVTMSEVVDVELGKVLAESKTVSDSGSLRMTSYADITYFAEDYVGTSLTF